jgi:hypothetical protein
MLSKHSTKPQCPLLVACQVATLAHSVTLVLEAPALVCCQSCMVYGFRN